MDDFDFVDVEGDMEGDGSRSANSKKKDVLEEDLQFSSEDEFDEVPFGTDEQSENAEMETIELNEVREGTESGVVLADDDSQQAAEAMVQLGNVGFYMADQQLLQQDESMDVDPNYDPSDFLLAGLPARDEKSENKIQDDLAVSESDDDAENNAKQKQKTSQQLSQPEEDVGGDLWF
ncbi:Transcription initiation factor TFIID subunit 1 [Habropoda laboriosa]|uniref:Transcription initiation factor TFIID subunit 1 n=2 Tax=Habropoda laboriosa TaxID=597456 RepID=A0A0L7QND0_9HYME|nr:Transcription initiation factor TFIID subunit 1 [Habropoda laboriosa]